MKHDSARLGIVNPLTLVGNELKGIIRERNFPHESVRLLDTTGEAGGALTDIGDEAAVVAVADENSFDDLDIVFFCGPAEKNEPWIRRSRTDDFFAIDLSQPSRMGAGSIPIVAGVNSDRLTSDSRLIVSPHPIAISLILLLHQILERAAIEFCTASVIQPASELGQEGIDELFQQTINVLNVASPPTKIFGRQLAFNLYPLPGASVLEPYVASQVHSVLGERVPLALSITQGTLFHNHAFSVFAKTSKPLSPREAIEALNASAAIHVGEDEDEPYSSIDAAAKDEVIVSRVNADPSVENGLWIWAAADNVRRGSALNAVLIAERLIEVLGERVN